MPVTQLGSNQIGNVNRGDLDVSTPGSSVIRKIIAGTNITITSTGADEGTGDVVINSTAAGGGGSGLTTGKAVAIATSNVFW